LVKREEMIVEPGVSRGRSQNCSEDPSEGRSEDWSKKARELLELGKRTDRSEWTAERRERIFQQVLARVARARERRRLMQAFAAGASTVLLVGLLLRLMGIGGPTAERRPELAGKMAVQPLAAD